MQEVKLPLAIDPVRAAQKRLSYSGIMTPGQLPRLNDAAPLVGVAQVELNCGVDAQKLAVLQGRVQARLSLVCQRCGAPFEQAFDVAFCYAPVAEGDDETQIPDAYEPVLLDEHGELNLHQLLEDELLLALPLIPRHEVADCLLDPQALTFGKIPEDAKPRNPFEVLSQLKKDREE